MKSIIPKELGFLPVNLGDIRAGLVLDLDLGQIVAGKVSDVSGLGNDGNIFGNVAKVNLVDLRSLEFFGSGGYVGFPNLGLFDGLKDFTFSIPIKYKSLGGVQSPVSFGGESLLIFDNGDNTPLDVISIRVNQSGWRNTVYSKPIKTGVLYVVTVVYSATDGWSMYLDGRQDLVEKKTDATTGAITSSGAVNSVGNLYGDNGIYWFDGMVGNLRVYNRALSAEEVRNLYLLTKRKMGLI